jgi:hypothetical protein
LAVERITAMKPIRFVDRVNDLFVTIIAAGAVAHAVRLGLEPDATDLKRIGRGSGQFPRR